MKCSECDQPCQGHWVDFGLGVIEFWGAMSTDKDEQYVSACCDATMEEEDAKSNT
jgi:hypothetical protein